MPRVLARSSWHLEPGAVPFLAGTCERTVLQAANRPVCTICSLQLAFYTADRVCKCWSRLTGSACATCVLAYSSGMLYHSCPQPSCLKWLCSPECRLAPCTFFTARTPCADSSCTGACFYSCYRHLTHAAHAHIGLSYSHKQAKHTEQSVGTDLGWGIDLSIEGWVTAA